MTDTAPDPLGVDGRPLTSLEWKIYCRAGIPADQVPSWIAAGIRPYQAEGYRAADLDLAAAVRLAAAGVTGNEALAIRDHRKLESLAAERTAEQKRLAPWTVVGLTPGDADIAAGHGASPAAVQLLVGGGYRSAHVAQLVVAGVDPTIAVEWRRAGVPLDHVLALHQLDLAAEAAADWSKHVVNPAAARDFAASGFTPDEAMPWFQNGISAADAREWQRHGFDAAFAHDWESQVVGATGPAWAAQGMTPDDAEDWHDVEMKPEPSAVLHRYRVTPTTYSALAALGFTFDLVVRLVEGGIAEPDLHVLVVFEIEADDLLQTVSLGADPVDAVRQIVARHQPPPLPSGAIRVTRITLDGRTRRTVLLASPDACVIERDGERETIAADTWAEAVQAVPDLHEVRPGEITSVEAPHLSPAELRSLVDLLVVAAPDDLDEDGEQWDDLDEKTIFPLPLEAVAPDLVGDGLGTRPIFVNGQRWAVAPTGDSARPAVVVPVDAERACDGELVAVVVESWASFGASEEASMVSGWSEWELGLATPTVLCESSRIDEVGNSSTYSVYDAGTRLAHIADWINRADTGVDLLPLAARTAAGLDTDDLTMFDYSPTLEYEFYLDLAPDEVEPFLDLLRQRHGDAVDECLEP